MESIEGVVFCDVLISQADRTEWFNNDAGKTSIHGGRNLVLGI